MDRRSFLRLVPGVGAAVVVPALAGCGDDSPSSGPAGSGGDAVPAGSALPPGSGGNGAGAPGTTAPASFAGYGPLGAPDANGLALPDGFTSRVVATSGQPVADTGFLWHVNPDGGAVFAQDDGGWIYVSNSESPIPDGGASMLRFSADGEVVEARRILEGSVINCAGGSTPWGTWLSCEEIPTGIVYECDPTGATPAVKRLALGVFKHEAAACDTVNEIIYLTEDDPEGVLYRFRPATWGDLSAGDLEVLVDDAGTLVWRVVPDPSAVTTPLKDQVPGARRFNGGEGADVADGVLWFTTKGDNRVWRLDRTADDTAELSVLWDGAVADDATVVADVDNLRLSASGLLYVAEDGPGLNLAVVGPDGAMWPVAQVTDAPGSEITGPAFSPDGTRLYFSSQREPGRTYEVTGPFA